MKNMKRLIIILIAVLAFFATTACDPGSIPIPTSTAIPTFTPTQTPTNDVPGPTSSRACNYNTGRFGAVGSGRVFYPCNMEDGVMYGATTLSGGMTNTKEQMYWLANELVRQNIIVFAISASNNMTVPSYTRAHENTVDKIKEENTRSGSPVAGKIGYIGISGFSMGGGATLNTANSKATDVDAAVAMAAFGPNRNLSSIDGPMLIIVGANDAIASANMHSAPAFDRLNKQIPAAYATLPNYQHTRWMMGGSDATKKLISAWFRWAFYEDQAAFQIVKNPPSPIRYNKKQNF